MLENPRLARPWRATRECCIATVESFLDAQTVTWIRVEFLQKFKELSFRER